MIEDIDNDKHLSACVAYNVPCQRVPQTTAPGDSPPLDLCAPDFGKEVTNEVLNPAIAGKVTGCIRSLRQRSSGIQKYCKDKGQDVDGGCGANAVLTQACKDIITKFLNDIGCPDCVEEYDTSMCLHLPVALESLSCTAATSCICHLPTSNTTLLLNG